MRVIEILKAKGDSVYQISPNASLAETVAQLVKCNCGALLVTERERVFGIITERDILKAIASQDRPLSELMVHDFMSTDLVTEQPSDDVNSIMGLMTSRRIRHLPILEDNGLAGMISIGDVVKAQFDLLCHENYFMRVYIQS